MKQAMLRQAKIRAYPGTLVTYSIGFVSSIILTLIAYSIATGTTFSKEAIIGTVMGLAVVQLIIQLVFFLHLGRETRPRWNLAAFFFMLIMISIIVVGSLWIMNNLNYNMMMTPEQMNEYMLDQNKKGF